MNGQHSGRRIPGRSARALSVVGVALWAATAIAPAVGSEGAPTAREILERADAAIKNVESIRYSGTATPGGVAEQFLSGAEGEALLSGWTGQFPQKFHVRLETKARDGADVNVTAGGDGDTFFLVDHLTRKGYEDMDPGVLGSSGQALQGFFMLEFVHDAPFDDELGAESIELEGEADVHGEACWKVRVVYAGGRGESTWLLSKKDYLPRGRIQHFNMGGQEGSIERTLRDLEIDPEIDPGLFKMRLADGYEAIDDFAP